MSQQIRFSLPSPGYLNQGGTKLDSGRVEGLAWGQKYTQAPSKKQHNRQDGEQIKQNLYLRELQVCNNVVCQQVYRLIVIKLQQRTRQLLRPLLV